MSAAEANLPPANLPPALLPVDEPVLPAPIPKPAWGVWLDGLLRWCGERMNPILIKEARQAMKSRQFSVTFCLLLVGAWLWSLIGVAFIGPGIHYAARGTDLFYGYHLVLSFPLLVVVPFTAFRSLAAEREDGTYELLSITALSPGQIIGGKLCSALLQILVYFSALAPCLAFTYLLRGISLPVIGLMLFYTVLASIGLSLIGLFLSTATTERHWQVLLSVLLIFALGGVYLFNIGIAATLLYEAGQAPVEESDFWLANLAVITFYLSYAVLIYQAAAARITFAQDNRSTPLRVTMLAQQLLFLGWMSYVWIFQDDYRLNALVFTLSVLGIHWYVMGVLLTSESSDLSPRLRRNLPQTVLGRTLFTWFNPGPGTGLVFALSNLLAGAVLCLLAVGWVAYNKYDTLVLVPGIGQWELGQFLSFIWLGFSFVVLYLGLGRLITAALQLVPALRVIAPLLIHVLVLLTALIVPLVLHLSVATFRGSAYSVVAIPNPLWTLGVLFDSVTYNSFDMTLAHLLVPLAAGVVALLNLPLVAWEIRFTRQATPQRVLQDEAELHPAPPLPVAVPTSPWS